MEPTSLRTYGGVAGADRRSERRARFIQAGLAILGDGDAELTVRGVCRRAGLAARYFYESFADRDALALAVYDHVVDEIATTTLAAVRSARRGRAKIHAGLANLVHQVRADPRRGRLLFSPALGNTVLAERRVESTRWFVRLLATETREVYGVADSPRLNLLAEILVGGVGQVLASWLDGTLVIDEEDLVNECTEVFLKVARLA